MIEKVNVLAGPKPKRFVCQLTIVVDQVCNQHFFKKEQISRNLLCLEKMLEKPLRETYQLQQTNKRSHVERHRFFHLATPKTAFLMRNLPIDPRNLGIFPNKQDHSLQFPKRNGGGLLLFPCSLRMLIQFQIFMCPSIKCS